MSFQDWIYLDNAATSYPKPDCVYEAVDRYQRENGRPVGRGATDAAQAVQLAVDRCRHRCAQLLGATAKEQIVFTSNGTDSLNAVLHGLLKPGDHVVTTIAEHNSVLRPLRHLERHANISLTIVDVDDLGAVSVSDLAAAIRPQTRLLVLQHASNVTGVLQPIEAACRLARERGILSLIDAAQTAGHVPLHVTNLGADFVACSGHKGLLGPLGTGVLYIAPGRHMLLEPQRQGGTGSRSELDTQPELMPDRFESGNHNVPGLVGLDAALGFLLSHTVEAIRAHELALSTVLVRRLMEIPNLMVFSVTDRSWHTGVVSFTSDTYAPDELSTLLSQHFHIDTRSGLHCAPGIHQRLGTLKTNGTVRLSLGWRSSMDDVDKVIDALNALHA